MVDKATQHWAFGARRPAAATKAESLDRCALPDAHTAPGNDGGPRRCRSRVPLQSKRLLAATLSAHGSASINEDRSAGLVDDGDRIDAREAGFATRAFRD